MQIKESDMAKVVVDYLDGGEIYQEVCGHGGIADIVWVCGQIVWVIETKLSLSMSLLSQATNWIGKAHFVSVATPVRRKKENDAAMEFMKWKGIGYMNVRMSQGRQRVFGVIEPRLNRTARVATLRESLCEKQKTYSIAGNSDNSYWSPYKETCRNIISKVKRHPGITMSELMEGLKHHYASSNSARSSIRHWAGAGKIKGIEMKSDGRLLRFYPKGDQIET